MIYFKLVLFLLLMIGLVRHDLRRRATIKRLKEYSVELMVMLGDEADGRRRDAEKIEALEYDKEAAGFMLMTVMSELPKGHVFNIAAEHNKQRKKRVGAYLQELGVSAARMPIPAQRTKE